MLKLGPIFARFGPLVKYVCTSNTSWFECFNVLRLFPSLYFSVFGKNKFGYLAFRGLGRDTASMQSQYFNLKSNNDEMINEIHLKYVSLDFPFFTICIPKRKKIAQARQSRFRNVVDIRFHHIGRCFKGEQQSYYLR